MKKEEKNIKSAADFDVWSGRVGGIAGFLTRDLTPREARLLAPLAKRAIELAPIEEAYVEISRGLFKVAGGFPATFLTLLDDVVTERSLPDILRDMHSPEEYCMLNAMKSFELRKVALRVLSWFYKEEK